MATTIDELLRRVYAYEKKHGRRPETLSVTADQMNKLHAEANLLLNYEIKKKRFCGVRLRVRNYGREAAKKEDREKYGIRSIRRLKIAGFHAEVYFPDAPVT